MKRQTWILHTTVALLAVTASACGGDITTTDAAGGTSQAVGVDADASVLWGAVCTVDADCAAPTDYCVIQPGKVEGYCTIVCPNLGADCVFEDWTCNIIGTCDAPGATWCGPPSEIEESGGFVVACE